MAVDLHTHSCCSDGSLTPSELMELAYEKKLSAIALTDHDTVSGIKEAKKAAEDLSITLIPGIEISSLYDLGNVVKEFHILGLGVDETDVQFLKKLEQYGALRQERNEKMLRLISENVCIIPEDILAIQPEKNLRMQALPASRLKAERNPHIIRQR